MHKPACPAIIDIEASGFGAHSYPLEIGAVNAKGERYCALIHPLADWNHWCEGAAQIHGITRELVEQRGKPVRQVCAELNQFLGEITCYSDAWTHDSPWLTRLYFGARCNPSFHLSPIELIATEDQLLCWDETKRRLQQQLGICRHRASGDAYLIQQTYLASRQLAQCPRKIAELRAAGKGL